MSQKSKEPSGFVERVRDQTRRYVNDLSQENGMLQKKVEVLECDARILESQLEVLNGELFQEREERKKLFRRMETMEELRASSIEEYAVVDEQNNDLASLYSATYSLHGTVDRVELLGVIREIVANLIGSEEMCVFERREGGRLDLITSLGVDEDLFADMTVDEGIIGHTVLTGERFLAEFGESNATAHERESGLIACVPLAVSGHVFGAIGVFNLLPQKEGLAPVDLELFDLLGSQAGIAVHAANLHERYGFSERE